MRTYRQTARARATARTAAAIDTATLREIASRGYAEARVVDIADRAGVSVRTVYLHAPSKDDLVRLALRQRADGLIAKVERWRPRSRGAADVIDELVALHARTYRDEKRMLEILVDRGVPRPAAAILRDLDAVRLAIITRTLTDLGRRGALRGRPADGIALAHALLAYPTWRIALTGPAGRRTPRLASLALRSALL